MQNNLCKSRVLRIIGLTEKEVTTALGGDIGKSDSLHLNLVPHPNGTIDLEIKSTAKVERMAQALLSAAEKEIRIKLQDNIYGIDEERLEEVVGYLLYLRRLTIAVAESCTGGLLSNKITDIPGSSLYYRGGIVAYDKEVKINLLNIQPGIIEKCGIVSREVAGSMAKQIAQMMQADIGVGITGYAGPEGNANGDDIGLVYIGVSSNDNFNILEFRFGGEREEIKEKAVYAALDMVRRGLLK
ncbi:MAG: nicotinamide-nucleotide amidohydrolase family protein [bacterium]|nr:nicotinamide-nucleotide amidohydrolase family protein [bacterium]